MLDRWSRPPIILFNFLVEYLVWIVEQTDFSINMPDTVVAKVGDIIMKANSTQVYGLL